MDFEIRPIHIDDTIGFHSALSAVAAEEVYLLTTKSPPIEKMEAFVRSNIDNQNAQYVASSHGEIIGWCDITPFSKQSMSHVGTLGMGVISKYRRKGIGSKLLKATMDHAWKQGLKRLELEVFSSNKIAIKMYEKHGYAIEGIKKNARYFNGQYEDIVIMAQYKSLTSSKTGQS